MQKWPLWKKIQVTQTKLLEWHMRHQGKVCVSFSGGKDSTVLLDLARKIDPDMPAVFVNTGLEYPEIISFVRSIENVIWLKPDMSFKSVLEEYGYPIVSKEVTYRIARARKGSNWAIMHLKGLSVDGCKSSYNARYIKWRHLLEAPFKISDKCCDVMKKKPLKKFSKESGLAEIVGTMASESFRRQSNYLKTGCNAYHLHKSQPMSFWTEQDVLEYLYSFNKPFSEIYGGITVDENGKYKTTGVKRTGCMFCMFGVQLEKTPNRFQLMRATHPKHYNHCINVLGCGKVLDYLNVPYDNQLI